MKYEMRGYQKLSINTLRDLFLKYRILLLVSPTGSGKTVIAARIVEFVIKNNKRVLFVAHRRELINQCSRKLDENGIDHGIIMGNHPRNRPECPVQVASIQTLINREMPPADLLIIDECVTGDTIVITEHGPTKIKDMPSTHCNTVLTKDSNSIKMGKITNWWCGGKKQIIKLTFSNGSTLKCTKEHLIMTQNGWVQAVNLTKTDKILSHVGVDVGGSSNDHQGQYYANVGAEHSLRKTNGGDNQNGSTDIMQKNKGVGQFHVNVDVEHFLRKIDGVDNKNGLLATTQKGKEPIGREDSSNTSVKPHYVLVVAGKKYTHGMVQHSNHSEKQKQKIRNIENTCQITTKDYPDFMLHLIMMKLVRLLALVLVILAYYYHILKHIIIDLYQTMVLDKKNGQNTKQNSYISWILHLQNLQILVGGKHIYEHDQDHYHALQKLCHSYTKPPQKLLQSTHSNYLTELVLPGGSAMTDQTIVDAYHCQHMVSLNQVLSQHKNGFSQILGIVKLEKITEGKDITSHLEQKQVIILSTKSDNMYQNPCDINYVHLSEMELVGEELVYDITVENTHNFFANGILVHNCHRSLSDTYQYIAQSYPNASILGLTATPWRGDGQGLGSFYEKMYVVAQVQQLVNEGHLLAPKVYVPYEPDLHGLHVVGGDYVDEEIDALMNINPLIEDIIDYWTINIKNKRTVVFACTVEHSKRVVEGFKKAGVKAEHLDCNTPTHNRDATLARIKSGETLVVSNVGILSEGWDCPEIECTILARPTKSLTLCLQMVGRGMRPLKGKTETVVVDFAGCILEHGMPTDDRDFTLEGYLPQKSIIKMCPNCGAVATTKSSICPNCGCTMTIKSLNMNKEELHRNLYEISKYRCVRCGGTNVHKYEMNIMHGYPLKCVDCGEISFIMNYYTMYASDEECLADYEELKRIQKSNNYHENWAKFKYMEIFQGS